MTENPWLLNTTEEAAPPVSVDATTVTRPTGPAAPQRGVTAPDQVDQLPTSEQPVPAALWCVGAHGGAGESTIAELMSGWRAAGHAWPLVANSTAAAPVVLVARSSVRGLQAAQTAATQWAAGLVPHVELLGLVIIADAPGRLPRALRDLARVVSGGVPRVWHLPWVEAWRLGESPRLEAAPREVRRAVNDIQTLLKPNSTTH